MAKNIPFVIQLFLITFLIMVAPCTVLMLYSNHTIMRYSDEEIAGAALSNIETSRRLNESIMDRVSAGIQRFVENQDYVEYRGLQKYASIQGNIENGLKVRKIQNELLAIVKNDEAIQSIFLIFDDADYVISTDRGVVELIDYFSLTWMRSVPSQRRGMGGVWVARELPSATLRTISVSNDTEKYVPALSYLYFLNRLTTALGGTIVANIPESFIAGNLNYNQNRQGRDGAYGTMLLQRNGKVISHPDSGRVLAQARNFPHIAWILDSGEKSGYAFFNDSGTASLYTWLKSDYSEWVYISAQSMENLSRRASRTNRRVMLLAALALFAGAAASVAILSWISRPMRRFVSALREDPAMKGSDIRNEMEFLNVAFGKIKQQETELHQILIEREKDTALLAVRSALSGDISGGQELELLGQLFPHPVFIVALAALDNYRDYRYRTSAELRAYHRYLFLNAAESLREPPLCIRGAQYSEGQIALIFNVPEDGENRCGQKIDAVLEGLRSKAFSLFAATLTIGLSDPCFGIREIHNSTRQAAEAVLTRMTRGNNSIYRSRSRQAAPQGQRRFFYPQNAESKILNYMDNNKPALVEAELDGIQQTILNSPAVSNDNVRFIYNQLAGVTIKHLTETGVNTARLFSNQADVYSAISSCDTLDEIRKIMGNFYQDILEYLNQDTEGNRELSGKILRYLEAHFREDAFFDDMAADLGISYSYMRKLVREATGKSVLDNINTLRVREAKYLLLSTEKSVAGIARELGYRNIQSLNRYFKKYEGFTPGEFRIAGASAAAKR
ncbi:MAG: AraC family transcriptional regulator [Treponema sp.]|jgi:AraC-like DNA-binding protein|nr:AraC family transcriptional regulator [Treponema sp.]